MYRTVFKIGLLDALAYRADFVVGFVSGLSLIVVQFFLWTAVFGSKAQIEGFDLSETVTYTALVWITNGFYATRWQSRDIQNKMLNGSIAYELLFPISFQAFTFLITSSKNALNLVISGLPAFAASVLLFGIAFPQPLDLMLFLVSLLLSFLISSGISFIIGMLGAFLKNIEGLIQAEAFLNTILSGALVPLAFLPPFLSQLASWLPFQGIVSTPLLLYLGKPEKTQVIWLLARQAGWAFVLFILGQFVYARACQRLQVYGG